MINIDMIKLKCILAEVAEGTYNWDPNLYSYFRYDRQEALLRIVSPKHDSALLHFTEKFALHFIASSLPDNSVVLEVGSCFGGSTSIIAHANKTLQIHAIDDFDDDFKYRHVDEGTPPNLSEYNNELMHWIPYEKRKEKILGPNTKRSLEKISEIVCKTYPNITFHKGSSPYDFYNHSLPHLLDQEIDMFFHDGDHFNPTMQKDIDFWFPKLKTNGIMMSHDYRAYVPKKLEKYTIPDVKNNINRLIEEQKVEKIGSVRSLVILRKIV